MSARWDRLDRNRVRTLRNMTDAGRPECLGELISVFFDTFAGQLSMLLDHAASGDLSGLRRLSRDLILSSSSLGAKALAEHCAELEKLSRSGQLDGLGELVAGIVDEFKAVRSELEALLPAAA